MPAEVFGLLAGIYRPLQKEKLVLFFSECVTTHNLGKIYVVLAVKVAVIAVPR